MRLFTAIDVSEAWRAEAVRAQRQLARDFESELRFVEPALLHVTVRFLGEVAADRLPGLVDAIEGLPPLSVRLNLEAAGSFGPTARPTVIWLGVGVATEDAGTLLRNIDQALGQAGVAFADQPWRPHLTLARVRRQVTAERRRRLAESLRALPSPRSQLLAARGVSLYQSDTGNRAPHHKLITRSAVS